MYPDQPIEYPYPGLGIEIGITGHGAYLVVGQVSNKGDIHEWNKEHKSEQLKTGDRIVRVNETKGALRMMKELDENKLLCLTIQSGLPKEASAEGEEEEYPSDTECIRADNVEAARRQQRAKRVLQVARASVKNRPFRRLPQPRRKGGAGAAHK